MADDSKHDINTIGKIATTRNERRLALDTCLTQYWLNEDIKRVERRDDPTWNGWDMWRRNGEPPPG